MARRIKDVYLDTRNARRTLKLSPKPFWRAVDKGLHIGYRKRANGGTWIARRFTESGKYQESKIGLADDFQDADDIKTFSYFQAQTAARKWEQKASRIEAGLEEEQNGPYTVDDALKDYMSHFKSEGKSISTTQTAINAHISPKLGSIQLDRLNSKKIENWLHSLAESPARVRSRKKAAHPKTKALTTDPDALRRRRASSNRILTILKAALNYAWNQGKVSSDMAWRKVKPYKNVDMPVIRYLTEAECVRLTNACPKDFRKMVQAALLTGCRYGELTKLVVTDFNSYNETLVIRMSKSGKPRHIILADEGKKFFEQAAINKNGSDLIFTHDKGLPWGKSHQSRPLIEACQVAKIKPAISFHILRHTHGSFLAMRGVPMSVIAQQLGHADTRMTEKHYAHLSPSYVAETIRQNFPKLGIVEHENIHSLKKVKK